MFEQALGCFISGFLSLFIAHLYYKKASKDLIIETSNLRILNNELKTSITALEELDEEIIQDTDIIKKIVTRGTTEDPEFPYK